MLYSNDAVECVDTIQSRIEKIEQLTLSPDEQQEMAQFTYQERLSRLEEGLNAETKTTEIEVLT